MKKKYNIPFVIAMIILVVLVGFLSGYLVMQKKTADRYRELAEQVQVDASEDVPEPEPESTETTLDELKETVDAPTEENPIDFRELWETNTDVFAWIRIPDTPVDYPVLHHLIGDSDFYLDHDWTGTYSPPGVPYAQSCYNLDIIDDYFTFIYGHNMKNETMFGSLKHYQEAEYREANPEIYIYTPEKVLKYRIVCAFTYEAISIPYYYDIADITARQQLLDDLQSNCLNPSWFDESHVFDGDDHMLFLSTCNGNKAQRFLVGAVLEDDVSGGEMQ